MKNLSCTPVSDSVGEANIALKSEKVYQDIIAFLATNVLGFAAPGSPGLHLTSNSQYFRNL